MTASHFDSDDLVGKAYDRRLVKRLLSYVRPHWRLVLLSVVLMGVATGLQLLVPYIIKEGIDRYLATLHHVCNPTAAQEETFRAIDPEGTRFIHAADGQWLVRKSALDDLDARLRLALLRESRVSSETYYIFPAAYRAEDVGRIAGEFWLVPENALGRVPPAVLARIRGADMQGIVDLALLAGLLIVLALVAGYGHTLAIQVAGQRAMYDLRTQLFAHVHDLSLRFLDRHPVGRLVTRVSNDIESINEMIASVLVNGPKDVLLCAGSVVILLALDLQLGLIACAVLPVAMAVLAVFRARVRGAYREVRRLLAQLNASLAEDISGMPVIQVFNRQEARRANFSRVNHAHFNANVRQVVIFGILRPLIELLAACGMALVLIWGGAGVLSGALTLGGLVAFLSYVRQMFRPMTELSEKYNILQSAMASSDRIFGILDATSDIRAPAAPVMPAAASGRVQFEDVCFAYTPGVPVLAHVSFTLQPGRTVAIVGPTGAGKTSILNLLCRLYDPDAGRILLDGVDLRRLHPAELSRRVAIVLQDAFVFSRTVEDNIRMGREMPRAHVAHAAAAVQALDFIEQLPQGFATLMAERGATLSSGQKQLLCFARALAHDPEVLILDEATRSVDPDTEQRIQSAIACLMRGRTSLVVAHRLSTIQRADEILVMDGGRIVERGAHQDLLAARGIYYNLYLLQYRNGSAAAP